MKLAVGSNCSPIPVQPCLLAENGNSLVVFLFTPTCKFDTVQVKNDKVIRNITCRGEKVRERIVKEISCSSEKCVSNYCSGTTTDLRRQGV